jgi:hypothetical protein
MIGGHGHPNLGTLGCIVLQREGWRRWNCERMVRMIRALLSLLLLLSLCRPALAQDQPKRIPVKFVCDCTDPVGLLYATAFRDLLAKSPRFEAAVNFDKTGGTPPNNPSMQVSVVTLNAWNAGDQAALSEVILVGETTLATHSVRVCGRTKAAGCAEDTLAQLDKVVQGLKDAYRNKR